MGLFDMYGDVMQQIGDTLKTADPFGPMGEAGDILSGLFHARELIADNGPEALWNLAGNTAEVASVALMLLPAAKQTDIISAGLKTVMGLQVLCGWTNEPTEGDGYSDSATRFNTVADSLQTAMPDDRWVGAASDAYRQANEVQRERAKKMVDADLSVRMAVSAEAGEVNSTRRILNNAATMMGNAIMPALAARAIPRIGKAVSMEIELAVVGVSLPTCLWHINQLSEHSAKAVESILAATRLYEEVAAAGYATRM